MNEPKVPSQYKDWEAIDIFLFTNGQQYSPPRKYHLRSEELNWWGATLGYLARSQYGSKHSLTNLYTLKGQKVAGPMELSNGVAYVAVLPQDTFIDAGYEKYVIKATRSWEKRQSRLSGSLGERTPEELTAKQEPANTEKEETVNVNIPIQGQMINATETDQNKTVKEVNKLGKPKTGLDTKHDSKIGSLPNTPKNVSHQSAEKRRPKTGDPPPGVPNAPEPKLNSKIPVKRRGSPVSRYLTTLESTEPISKNVPPKTTLNRPKTPLKPKKAEPIVTQKIPTKTTVRPVAKTFLPKNTGQTTDIAQIGNVDGNDIIVVSNLFRNSESDIMSTLLCVNDATIVNNATKNNKMSLDNAPKKAEAEMSELPVIKELVTANNNKEYNDLNNAPGRPKDMNFDLKESNSQITHMEYLITTPQSLWDNTINTQVPLQGNVHYDDKPTVNDSLQKKEEKTDNIQVPIANNNTINKDGISVNTASIQHLNALADKPGGEPLMALVNKGDIISLKLDIEVRNTDGVVHTVLKSSMMHPEAKIPKGSNDKNNSHVSINDGGKSIAPNDDQPHICMCCQNCQRKQDLVFNCACCDCSYNQTDTSRNNINDKNNEAKSYFVILPVPANYNNERLRDLEVTNNYGQNTETLTKINRITAANEMFIVSKKSKHDKTDNTIQIKGIPDIALKKSEVSKISFVSSQMNMVAQIVYQMPDKKTWEGLVVKRDDKSQSVSGQHMSGIQINSKKILEDRSAQTEWHNILMEIRRCEDGHYTFYLPPLSMLRRYNVSHF